MTLVEVMVALTIVVMVFAGTLAGLVQSRRLTEGSLAQSNAQAAVASYMEQLKSMPIYQLIGDPNQTVDNAGNYTPNLGASFSLPTIQNDSTAGADPLMTSNGTAIPTISSLIPGQTPTGVIDNLKEVPANPSNPGSATTWNAVWPAAQLSTANETNTTPMSNNLHVNIWVWVTDLSGTSTYAQNVYGITMIYTWQFKDGLGTQYFIGTLRSVRSIVKTY